MAVYGPASPSTPVVHTVRLRTYQYSPARRARGRPPASAAAACRSVAAARADSAPSRPSRAEGRISAAAATAATAAMPTAARGTQRGPRDRGAGRQARSARAVAAASGPGASARKERIRSRSSMVLGPQLVELTGGGERLADTAARTMQA